MFSLAETKTPLSQISEHARGARFDLETLNEFDRLLLTVAPPDATGGRPGIEPSMASHDWEIYSDVRIRTEAARPQATYLIEQLGSRLASDWETEFPESMAAGGGSALLARTVPNVTMRPAHLGRDIDLTMVVAGVFAVGPEEVWGVRIANTIDVPATVDDQGGSRAIAAALAPDTVIPILREIGERDVASRIAELIQLRESEPDDEPISLDSLRLASQFVLTAPRYSHPSIAMTEDGLLSFQWRLVPEGMIVILFRSDGLITYVARGSQASERADQVRARGTDSLTDTLVALELFEGWLPVR